MSLDLFGNLIQETNKTKTFEEEYAEYINSSAWKRIRKAKIDQVGGKCERCGISKWSVDLQVHHKTYAHFKHERMDELEVLCPKCHEGADEQRIIEKEISKANSPLRIGFENWMDNSKDQHWRRLTDRGMERCWNEFLRYLSQKTGRKYSTPFERMDTWYEEIP